MRVRPSDLAPEGDLPVVPDDSKETSLMSSEELLEEHQGLRLLEVSYDEGDEPDAETEADAEAISAGGGPHVQGAAAESAISAGGRGDRGSDRSDRSAAEQLKGEPSIEHRIQIESGWPTGDRFHGPLPSWAYSADQQGVPLPPQSWLTERAKSEECSEGTKRPS